MVTVLDHKPSKLDKTVFTKNSPPCINIKKDLNINSFNDLVVLLPDKLIQVRNTSDYMCQ